MLNSKSSNHEKDTKLYTLAFNDAFYSFM
jgi:hypothetical protein